MTDSKQLPDFIRKGPGMAVKFLAAGVTGGLENVACSYKRMERPAAHRAVGRSVAVPEDSVKRPFFVLPALTRLKPALCGVFLALTLGFPVFALESPALGKEIPHGLGKKESCRKTDDKAGNDGNACTGSGQVSPEFDKDFLHHAYLVDFFVSFFAALLFSLLPPLAVIIAQKIQNSTKERN